jgi:4-hydroxybenzoate polyprenyltransferase
MKPHDLWRLMRPHQWIKNAFVLVGLLFGHGWQNGSLVVAVLLATAAFCLVSSAVYVLNDLVDREQDKLHPHKKNRPLASGRVSTDQAAALGAVLAIGGLMLGAWAGMGVVAILLIYAATNLAYTFGLKHVVILDVFMIATGFMLRILAGTLAVGIPPSQWLLLCGLMITLFLGFAKRRAEIIALTEDKASHRPVLEHYTPELLDKMIAVTAAGVILSYSLYTMSPETLRLHGTANLIYTVPFVLYGIFRYIYLLHRDEGGGDPARELLTDRHLGVTVLFWLATTLALIA